MAFEDRSAWWLTDGEERHRLAPRSFFIPPPEHRGGLEAGRLVKLGFACEPRLVDGQQQSGERLWVAISRGLQDGRYVGTLQGDPVVVPELRSGDEITFEPRHVLTIDYFPGELGYDPGEAAAVDPEILAHDRAPTRVVRFQPPGSPAPLWFVALDGDVPPEAHLVPLGRLTDFWPELAPVFAAGGGDWLRHPERPEYLADSIEHQRSVATAALTHAAGLVLQHPEDPLAAEAEAHFENVVEAVVGLHWSGDGRPDGVAHAGLARGRDRVRLSGLVRVKDAPDRPIIVDVSPVAGGTVQVDAPAPKRSRLRPARTERTSDPQGGMFTVDVPAPFAPERHLASGDGPPEDRDQGPGPGDGTT